VTRALSPAEAAVGWRGERADAAHCRERFEAAGGAHPLACTAAAERCPAALALDRLFQARCAWDRLVPARRGPGPSDSSTGEIAAALATTPHRIALRAATG
jgi:hypothetical protein